MATKKPAKKAAAKNRGGQCERARELILQGKTNQQVWDVVRKEFSKSRLGLSGIGWLRNELRHNGKKVKTNRQLTAAAAKPAKKAA